jgi:voltage-gated potassium channel
VANVRRIERALAVLAFVLLAGTVGYAALGFPFLDALYQTVTTVSTVGFREVKPLSTTGKVFTIVLILFGTGTALYTFGVLLESLIEGHLRQHLEARRMARDIDSMSGHVIICGWGRVGHASAEYLTATGRRIVIVDRNQDRLAGVPYSHVLGDVTDDNVLLSAGIRHAQALIAALDTDADNVYVTLSSRALRPDLVIVARARNDASKSKLVRAGADRVVNPQLLGGHRMASYALQPHVAEFLEGVLHDESLDYRIEQIEIGAGCHVVGKQLHESRILEESGVQLLAIRPAAATGFVANPSADTTLEPGAILIVVGTGGQLAALRGLVTER